MADKFCWSGATGANNGSTWEDAYVSLMRDWGAEAGFTAGTDFIYVRSTHNETSASTLTLTGATAEGTNDPPRVLSVAGADTGTSPGALTSGASVTTTDTTADINIAEKLFIHGVEFYSNDDIWLGSAGGDSWLHLENCRLELTGTISTDQISLGNSSNYGQRIELIDTNIDFANASQGFNLRGCDALWDGGSLGFNVNNIFENIYSGPSTLDVKNVDLATCSNNLASGSLPAIWCKVSFERCKLNASATLLSGTIDLPGLEFNFHHCQSGTDSDPAYQMKRYTYQGTVEVDTARYRTDGASDGERTNEYSWSMDTSAGSNVIELYEPLESPPIAGWTDGDGSTSHTYRIYVASGATLQDDECWVELIGPNDAAQDSLGVRKTTRPDPLATPANLTTDSSSTWNGADVGTKQQIDISYTPDKPGPVTARVYLAKPSERVSIDPKIYIDPS
jgi:hypothetical protein